MLETDDIADRDFESGYEREVVERVWSLAQTVANNDPSVWRKDESGAWMHRQAYRNRHSEFGWEIANISFSSRGAGIASLRPMQWQNYVDFMVAARTGSAVTAEGLKNVRRLL
ncbi:MAG: hypothetical protein K1X78_07755 [Verrucomicrobiaceae bacterium]|nr:hypothetical protein [Verrucomicrobiaceae bacterium]